MRMTAQLIDGLRFLVTAGQHALVADATPDEGGTGTCMNSRQLFVASVAACVLSFAANSLRLHDLPVESLSLEMDYEEAQRPQRISRIDMRIHVRPPLSEERRRGILAVARRAIVPNTLRQPPDITISLE